MVKSVYNTINHKQIKAFGNTMNSGAGAQQDLVCVGGHSHTRYYYHSKAAGTGQAGPVVMSPDF